MTQDDLHVVGWRIRVLRKGQSLSQHELATKAGMSLRFLAQLESGSTNISVMRLARLARALEVSMVTLLCGLGPQDSLGRHTAIAALQMNAVPMDKG